MNCKKCGKKLTGKNMAWSRGFSGYCRKCELKTCKEEGLPDSIVCFGVATERSISHIDCQVT